MIMMVTMLPVLRSRPSSAARPREGAPACRGEERRGGRAMAAPAEGAPMDAWMGHLPEAARRERSLCSLALPSAHNAGARKGTTGVSTIGLTVNCMCFDRGTFWGTPVNLLLYLKNRAYPFPYSVKTH